MSVNPSRDFNTGGKLAGKIFPATVVNNNDPTKRQRVQIKVDGPLHDGMPTDHLPWALRNGSPGKGTTGAVHEIGVPVNGSKVFVMFMDDSDENPIVLGAAHIGVPNGELIGADYTHCYGWIDEANNLFLVNTAQRTMDIHMSTGAQIFCDAAGGIQATAAGPSNLSVQGQLNIQATGALNIGSQVGVRVTGPYVTMAPGGGASPTPPVTR